MALAAKRLAHGGKRPGTYSAKVRPMKNRKQPFVLTQVRCEDEAIVEVKGREGFWPLRRPVRFKVGTNCDSITVEGGELLVRRDGTPIAAASTALVGRRAAGSANTSGEKPPARTNFAPSIP